LARQINYVALVAGVLTLVLIAASIFIPWWQFSVGNPSFAAVNFSPVNFNFALFNTFMTVPLILALNVASLLILLSGGIALLIYSVLPTKSYAKALLGFGYKKPLYAFIIFIVELLILYFSATLLSGINFPLIGSAALTLPSTFMPGSVSVSVEVSAAFGWTFYFAIAVVALCIAARFFHKKAAAQPAAPVNLTAPANPAPAPALA
jgi:hypothetical protein